MEERTNQILENIDREDCLGISIIDRIFIFCFSLLILRFFINFNNFFFIRCRTCLVGRQVEILHQPSLSTLLVLPYLLVRGHKAN